MRAAAAVALGLVCGECSLLNTSSSSLPVGRWGGDDAGLIVSDSGAHLHIGCTYGDVSGAIAVDMDGRFDVAETHNIHAFPVDRGVLLPARLAGQVSFPSLAFTVTVDDTVEHRTVVLGPVRVVFGKDAQMGPCPICRTPADIRRRLSARGTMIPGSAQPRPAPRP